ncbi:MAG TPA: tetratricopeptide repeat protein [Verrucomicrobiae bacterium]|jgi:tetratricopeptide (TPR) repeat protein
MAEKTISQISRPIREQYQKGMTAFDRKNFDYAIAIFNQVLAQEPAFFDCRQALRVCQHSKSGGGSTFFKKMLSGAGSSPLLAKAQMQKDPLEAIKTAEQILNSDANSVAAHKLLADNALAADLPKTAVLSLELAVKHAPKDEDVQKSLARAYSAAGQGEKAEMIMAELMRLHPGDLQLADELKDISARKTLAEGGYDALASGTGSYRDILKDKSKAEALEQESRQVKSEDVAQRQINKLEAELKLQPGDLKKLRTVAELYAQQKNYDRALETYRRIVEQEGASDPSLQKAIAETTIRKFDAAIAALDPKAPDYAEKSAQIKLERDNYNLAEVKERAERYPSDLGIRFELGVLLFKTGRVGDAMPEFQKAKDNPHKRLQALSYLGQCLAARGFNDMAARQLQTAIKEKLVFDDEKKEMTYALAAVFEKMNKQNDADELYKQIYEVDMSFKDVMAKVEASYNRPPPEG